MSYIGNEPRFTQFPSKYFNGDGTAMTVSLDYAPPNKAALLVFISGVRQDTDAYTISGTSLTFTGSVPSGTNNVQVVHLGLTVQVPAPADDTITTAKIQDDAVTTAKIADDNVTTAKILDDNVTTAKILDNNVTLAKLDDGTQGDILYYGASGAPARLGFGTSGDFLKTQGTGANPVWGTVTEYNDAAILNDIATLALHSAVQNNQAAYNLSNAFIDQYEDSSGIDVETDTGRNTSGEYMTSLVEAGPFGGIDSNTVLCMHMDGADDGNVWTDSSTSGHTITNTNSSGSPIVTKTGIKKFGTASGYRPGNANSLNIPDSTDWHMAGGDFTIESWVYSTGIPSDQWILTQNDASGNASWGIHIDTTTSKLEGLYQYGASSSIDFAGTTSLVGSTWYHCAMARDGNTLRLYLDGVEENTYDISANPTMYDSSSKCIIMAVYPYGTSGVIGYMDEVRVSKGICRYPDGTTFTPQTIAYHADTLNATGNYTSTTQTALATVSNMGIVVLYTNTSGTAALNTDLIAAVSADGGSNYTTTTLTAGGTFSTGINIAVANDVTISNTGTAPKYKISFANQSDGSKETRVNGVAMLY